MKDATLTENLSLEKKKVKFKKGNLKNTLKAFLPLFIIWFGIGEFPKILLIAWSTFIPVLVYTLDGLKSVNSTLVRSALSLGASQKQIFTRVIIPSAIPSILVGVEVSLGLSFSALVVSEMMGAESGLG